jgi:hypothetical protein
MYNSQQQTLEHQHSPPDVRLTQPHITANEVYRHELVALAMRI